MTIIEHRFSYGKSQVRFIRGGTGGRILILFHGFGQDCYVFKEFIDAYSNHFTVYAFDLFFHGQSNWNYGEEPVEKEYWSGLMQHFLTEHNIGRFSVGGFSIGARFALATVEAFPSLIDRAYLIAPDGIGSDPVYSLATYPIHFRRLFKRMVYKPWPFFLLAKLIRSARLINPSVVRFAESQMKSVEKREQVYYSWVVFRHLSFRPAGLARKINDHHIPVAIILGEKDKVITRSRLKSFIDRLISPAIIMARSGHNELIGVIAQQGLLQVLNEND